MSYEVDQSAVQARDERWMIEPVDERLTTSPGDERWMTNPRDKQQIRIPGHARVCDINDVHSE